MFIKESLSSSSSTLSNNTNSLSLPNLHTTTFEPAPKKFSYNDLPKGFEPPMTSPEIFDSYFSKLCDNSPNFSRSPIPIFVIPDTASDDHLYQLANLIRRNNDKDPVLQLVHKTNPSAKSIYIRQSKFENYKPKLYDPELQLRSHSTCYLGLTVILAVAIYSANKVVSKNIEPTQNTPLLIDKDTGLTHGTFGKTLASLFVFLYASFDTWVTSLLVIGNAYFINLALQQPPTQNPDLKNFLKTLQNYTILNSTKDTYTMFIPGARYKNFIPPPASTIVLTGTLKNIDDITFVEQLFDGTKIQSLGNYPINPIALIMKEKTLKASKDTEGLTKIINRATQFPAISSEILDTHHIADSDISSPHITNYFDNTFNRITMLSKNYYHDLFFAFFQAVIQETKSFLSDLDSFQSPINPKGLIEVSDVFKAYSKKNTLGLVMGHESGTGKTTLLTMFQTCLINTLNDLAKTRGVTAIQIGSIHYFVTGDKGNRSKKLFKGKHCLLNLLLNSVRAVLILSAFSTSALSKLFLKIYSQKASKHIKNNKLTSECMIGSPDTLPLQPFGTLYSASTAEHIILPPLKFFCASVITYIACKNFYQHFSTQSIKEIPIFGPSDENTSDKNKTTSSCILTINRMLHGNSRDQAVTLYNQPNTWVSLVPTNEPSVMNDLKEDGYTSIESRLYHDIKEQDILATIIKEKLTSSGILKKRENTSAICKEMTKNFITSGKIKVDHLNLHHAYLYHLYKENKKKIS